MNMKVAPDASQNPRMVEHDSGCFRELLCRCKYFEVERIQVTKGFIFFYGSVFSGADVLE